jgi:hypothetical protein
MKNTPLQKSWRFLILKSMTFPRYASPPAGKAAYNEQR